jgi:hypothetical protein
VEFAVVAVALAGLMVLMIWAISRPRNSRVSRGPGPGAAGAVYDMLNEDKRRAIEIIVEGRAEATDPETADDIPDEETPPKPKQTKHT